MANSESNREINSFPEALRAEGHAGVDPSVSSDQDALWSLLDEWKAGEPSPDFDATVMARIREEREAEEAKSPAIGWQALTRVWNSLWSPRGVAFAGVAATVLLAAVMLRGPEPPVPDPVKPAAAHEISAQQVEMALEDLQMLEDLYAAGAVDEGSQNNKI